MDFSKLSSKLLSQESLVRSLRASLLTVGLLVLPLASCRGAGPDVILTPALIADRTQVRTAESFKVRLLVTLPDGSVTISKNRVRFPAGAWITLVSEAEMNE